MLISHKFKCIFVHIQKTGGTSVREVLLKSDPDAIDAVIPSLNGGPSLQGRHHPAQLIKQQVGADIWTEYLTFSFVRNPWDRLVSWYHMITSRQPHAPLAFWEFVQNNTSTFEEFLECCDKEVVETNGVVKNIYKNQWHYLADREGNLLVDFVGKFENLCADFDTIAMRLNLSAGLPKLNQSEHSHYSHY